jgi:hypothetical protein
VAAVAAELVGRGIHFVTPRTASSHADARIIHAFAVVHVFGPDNPVGVFVFHAALLICLSSNRTKRLNPRRRRAARAFGFVEKPAPPPVVSSNRKI